MDVSHLEDTLSRNVGKLPTIDCAEFQKSEGLNYTAADA
jgi:hypothetical protein